jgi:VanZ family protein
MVRAIRASIGFEKLLTSAFLALAIGIAIAIGDELFQSTVPGRIPSHLDVMADAAGLVCAQLVYMWFAKE